MKLRTNMAIFLLFFGASLVTAFKDGNWIMSAFWVAIGLVFYFADRGGK